MLFASHVELSMFWMRKEILYFNFRNKIFNKIQKMKNLIQIIIGFYCFLFLTVSCTDTPQSASMLPIIEIGKSFDGKKAPVKLS